MASALPPGYTPAMMSTASQGPGIVAGVIVLAVLAFASTCLRLASRRLKGLVFGVDDWLMLAALPVAIALAAVTALDTRYGLGKHVLAVPMAEAPKYAKVFVGTQILWAVCTPIVKLSILALYLRIFGSARWIRWSCISLIVYTAGWMISASITLGLQCIPLEKVWDPTVAGHCINSNAFYKAGSATDVVGDFAILFLPIPAVWDLQMPLKKKLGIISIFTLGSLTCIISLARLIELVHALGGEKDITWAAALPSAWSVAEPCLGIFCANLPTMRPFVQYMTDSYYRLTTRSGNTRKGISAESEDSTNILSGSSRSIKKKYRGGEHGFQSLHDSDDTSKNVSVQSRSLARDDEHELELAQHWPHDARHPDKIYTMTTIDVERR